MFSVFKNWTGSLRFLHTTVKDNTVEWQRFLPFAHQVKRVVNAIDCVGQYDMALEWTEQNIQVLLCTHAEAF